MGRPTLIAHASARAENEHEILRKFPRPAALACPCYSQPREIHRGGSLVGRRPHHERIETVDAAQRRPLRRLFAGPGC